MGQQVGIDQRVNGIPSPTSGAMVLPTHGSAGYAGWSSIEPTQGCSPVMIHLDDPIGETANGLTCGDVAGQEIVVKQTRGIVMFVRRPTAVSIPAPCVPMDP